MKKLMTLILTFALAMCSMLTVAAEENSSASSAAPREVENITASMVAFFDSYGVDISEESTVEIIPFVADEGSAICVTNEVGNELVKDVFIVFSKDEDNNTVVDTSFDTMFGGGGAEVQPLDSETGSFPPISWNGDYIVHATAYYNKYSGNNVTCYRPYRCTYYYENYAGVTVNSIRVDYITYGYLYELTNYTEVQSSEYTHTIVASQSSPTANTTYSGYGQLAGNRGLKIDIGAPGLGMFLTFTNVVDGVTETYSIPLGG